MTNYQAENELLCIIFLEHSYSIPQQGTEVSYSNLEDGSTKPREKLFAFNSTRLSQKGSAGISHLKANMEMEKLWQTWNTLGSPHASGHGEVSSHYISLRLTQSVVFKAGTSYLRHYPYPYYLCCIFLCCLSSRGSGIFKLQGSFPMQPSLGWNEVVVQLLTGTLHNNGEGPS